MGRKPVAWPTGVEPVGSSLRIRFMWNGRRRCETLALPQTPQGVQAAAGIRAQVVQLAKLGMLTDAKYAELFPSSSYIAHAKTPTFGEYAQDWLDSREVVAGTRRNYLWALNQYWMPELATKYLDEITSPMLRKIIVSTSFPSAGAKRNAIVRLNAVLNTAMLDGLIARNPVSSIEKPKTGKKEIDPFTADEAERISAHLYATSNERNRVYAAYFEFAFYTGMRPAEIMALRWSEVDTAKRTARVCRVVAERTVHERVKNKRPRTVLLNPRALHALEVAAEIRAARRQQKLAFPESPYVFPPVKTHEFIQESSVTSKHFKQALRELGVRDRPQYNCRHTYATVCLMAGMNPAFIASQLGHSVQMLLSTYARWLDSSSDWSELAKLENSEIGTELVRPSTPTP